MHPTGIATYCRILKNYGQFREPVIGVRNGPNFDRLSVSLAVFLSCKCGGDSPSPSTNDCSVHLRHGPPNGSPSISIIIRHQKIPVSFHTAHPSIPIQKFCHSSNSIQGSLLFPYNVEKGCFLKNNYFNSKLSKKQYKRREMQTPVLFCQ